MSFLLPFALLTALLAAGPFVAHALRRGQATAIFFPAAKLVEKQTITARSQKRLQDRSLLGLRVLLILGLALLGASPLLSCSRLSLARTGGSSVAVALLIDDSASMRAKVGGRTKFELARGGALELLSSARTGDAFAVILAGKPARILTPATTDLGAVRTTLQALAVSDRPTDLQAALQLSESTLKALPQQDHQLVVLSDLATAEPPTLPANVLLPLPALRSPLENCALTRSSNQDQSVLVEVGCTSAQAAQGRQVELVDAAGKAVAEAPLTDFVTLTPAKVESWANARVRLTPAQPRAADQIAEDDTGAVLMSDGQMVVALRADDDRSGLRTSGSTVLKTALDALETRAKLQPLTLVPTRLPELTPFAVLLIDDPAGFTPETAQALDEYLQQGGVVGAFLGPGLKSTPLGSDFRPLLEGAPSWSRTGTIQLDTQAELAFGPLTTGWSDLAPSGRAILEPPAQGRVLARFTDGAPLLLERNHGRGLLVVSALPTSLDESDFALRPAFLALLDHLIHQAGLRTGSAASECGTPWELPAGSHVDGPAGPLEGKPNEGGVVVEPDLAGAYRIQRGGQTHLRYAVVDPQESIRQPRQPSATQLRKSSVSARQQVDISREIALILLGLAVAELGLRLLLGERRGRAGRPRAELV